MISPSPPPSSQYWSGSNTELSNKDDLSDDYKKCCDDDDLSDDYKKCCDDIIIKLGEANGTNQLPNAASRSGLWNQVFTNGWNTNCPNKHPGGIGDEESSR